MFLSCSWLDKRDGCTDAACGCPSWLSVIRQQTDFGDGHVGALVEEGQNWGLGREKHLHSVAVGWQVCYSEPKRKSRALNSSWVFWVKINLKMQMQ